MRYLVKAIFVSLLCVASMANAGTVAGKVKSLKACMASNSNGYAFMKIQTSQGTDKVVLLQMHEIPVQQRNVRKAMYSTLLTAFISDLDVEVEYTSGPGTLCGIAYDDYALSVDLGTGF